MAVHSKQGPVGKAKSSEIASGEKWRQTANELLIRYPSPFRYVQQQNIDECPTIGI